MEEKRLFALRGATQSLNLAEDIQKQTVELYNELLLKNKLGEEEIVSVIFSVTGDLDAKNPAAALREAGRAKDTALFVCREARFRDGLERVIRLLVHCRLDAAQAPIHVYRNGAGILRPDLSGGIEMPDLQLPGV